MNLGIVVPYLLTQMVFDSQSLGVRSISAPAFFLVQLMNPNDLRRQRFNFLWGRNLFLLGAYAAQARAS
jgi:hypothetical protein